MGLESRKKLAQTLKETSKQDRENVLSKSKNSPEYWDARTEKIKQRQEEQEIDGGLGVFIPKKTLYHGSNMHGIEKFNEAEETTVGDGVYLTSEAGDAIKYADRRSHYRGSKSVIYESVIENIKLCDLRKQKNLEKITTGFRQILLLELKKIDLPIYQESALWSVLELIDAKNVKSVRDLAYNHGSLFRDYLKSLGYEGLITFEGGEGENRKDHDTYLIFDPEKVQINTEQEVAVPAAEGSVSDQKTS